MAYLLLLLTLALGDAPPRFGWKLTHAERQRVLLRQLETPEAAPIPQIWPVVPEALPVPKVVPVPEAAPVLVVPDLFPDPRLKLLRREPNERWRPPGK